MTSALRSFCLAVGACCLVGGCALPFGPEEFRISAAPMADTAPMDAPVAFVETRLRRGNGVVYNRLGGEIPRGAPIEPIEERELGEVTTPAAG